MFFGDFPVTKETINEITANTKNTAKSVLPMSIDIPAIPPAPNKKATSAKIKNAIAARTM